MRISILNAIVLSLGYIAVLNALAFPSVGTRDISRGIEAFESHGIVGHLESRSPRARAGARPARARPDRPSKKKTKKTPTKKKTPARKKTPAKKKTSTRKKAATSEKAPVKGKTATRRKKAVKKRPSKKRPGARKPTRTQPSRSSITKPTNAKSKSTSSVKLLPFTLPPRPTKGTDVCLISGIDCHTDVKRGEGSSIIKAQSDQLHSFEKRARGFNVPLTGGKLTLTDKDYYLSGQLIRGDAGPKWDEAWVDYETTLLSNANVKLYKKRPVNLQQGSPRVYRSEHILELQTMSRFIEAITQTKSKGNKDPIQLSVTIDGQWFQKWWNKDIQSKIDSRNPKFKGYQNHNMAIHKDKTLNNVIFEAFGSKRNVKDFVLCEDTINSLKAKIWMNNNFAREWNTQTPKAAKGFMSSDDYLSVIRTILAVYNYMELPLVTSNMRSTIENIRTEFGNIAHLTDNDLPKDAQGQDVDLAALWIEFMDKQLERFTNTGKDRLRDMIQTGTEAFKAELVVMKGWLKKISKTPSNAVKQRHNAAVRQYKIEKNKLKGEKRTLRMAEKKVLEELGVIEKKCNGVQVDIDKEKKKQGTPYSNAVKSMKSAIKDVTESEQNVGTAVRKILEHDKDDLPKQIQNWKAIIAQLQKFEADRLKIKVLKAQ